MVSRLISDLSRSSLSASCFLLWDICITFDREVEYIWSKPSNSWTKWAFLFVRYFSLLTQFCFRAIEFHIIYDPSFTIAHKSALQIWFGLQVVPVFLIMLGAEIVMMARVYALYNKHRWVGVGFLLILFAEVTAVAIGLGLTFPRNDIHSFDLITHSSQSFVYFSIAALLSQVIILILSIIRYVRGRWGRARIIQLMIRDGTIAFCVLVVETGSLLLFILKDLPYSATDSAWMISCIASVECRLILNLEQHSDITSQCSTSTYSGHPELTTVLTIHDRYFEETERRQSLFSV
ncbi:hypothetical protein E1B28_000545 [Marasmius oreades]|uniref:DUF6533 domain-containing protein n=1 Tax=Marasmius oreades TaxID=181124 RepID=A0A9P8AEL0_9AGAR|nr:uncharacterized protein E1B28_000545 [Marasmius oreades]KAG7098623.1 hypothetical protein E1B28_000545 [Marasmius oreades]